VTDELFCDDRHRAIGFPGGACDFPNSRTACLPEPGHKFPRSKSSTILRTPLIPPHRRGHDFLAVVQDQRVGQVRKRIGFGFVVIGVKGRLRIISIPAPANRSDVQQIHHALDDPAPWRHYYFHHQNLERKAGGALVAASAVATAKTESASEQARAVKHARRC